MKIVILGAGVTGSSVAGALASEENDIVVIDKNAHLLTALKGRLDIATVEGNAAHPSVLEQAGIAFAAASAIWPAGTVTQLHGSSPVAC